MELRCSRRPKCSTSICVGTVRVESYAIELYSGTPSASAAAKSSGGSTRTSTDAQWSRGTPLSCSSPKELNSRVAASIGYSTKSGSWKAPLLSTPKRAPAARGLSSSSSSSPAEMNSGSTAKPTIFICLRKSLTSMVSIRTRSTARGSSSCAVSTSFPSLNLGK